MIDSNYISKFLPVHELDNLGPNTQMDPNDPTKWMFVNLSDDDLFLVSKLCSEATDTDDAVMVSKSLKYGNLRDKLSDDFSIQIIKDNIYTLSTDLCEFSCDMYLRKIPWLSDFTVLCCTTLSNELKSDIRWISGTYIPQVSGNLTTLINTVSVGLDNKKVEKYDGVITALSVLSSGTLVELSDGYFIKSFTITDGQVQTLGIGDVDLVSKYLTIDGQKVAGGTILGDTDSISTTILNVNNLRQLTYNVQEDSYVTLELSILESDSCDKPLEVWLHNHKPDSFGSSVQGGENVDLKVHQFNNPGGFSGTQYYNYYHTGFPVKQITTLDEKSATSVIIKYQDGSAFLRDTTGMSRCIFRENPYYATIARDEISTFVKSIQPPPGDSGTKELFKIRVSQQGLVKEYEKYQMSAVGDDIPPPSVTQAGTIKTGKANNYTSSTQTLGVRVDGDRNAYVEEIRATTSNYGSIKLGSSDVNTGTAQTHSVRMTSSGDAYVNVQNASSTAYGTVKVHASTDAAADSSGYLRHPVKMDSNGQLYVDILEGRPGTHDQYSLQRTTEYAGDDTTRYLQARANDGYGFVTLPKATNTSYGTIKAGNATTPGQVYIDPNDGIAKVTVGGSAYLPTAGGTMTGTIWFSGATYIARSDAAYYLGLYGGTGWGSGACITLNGMYENVPSLGTAGAFYITAHNGEKVCQLYGSPDGTLTWGGSTLVNSSNIVNYTANSMASMANYDYIYATNLWDSEWNDWGSGNHPRYYKIITLSPAITKKCTAMVEFKHLCTDKPSYGIEVRIRNYEQIRTKSDGTPVYGNVMKFSSIFHPKYNTAYNITNTDGVAYDQRFCGGIPGATSIILQSDNKGFESRDYVDKITVYFKAI